jgi:hypothetical protein
MDEHIMKNKHGLWVFIYIPSEENFYRSPFSSHWQTLSHNVVSGTPCHEWDQIKLFQLSRILTGVIKCWSINYNYSLHNLDFWLSKYIIYDKKENMKCKCCTIKQATQISPDPKGHVSFCHQLASLLFVHKPCKYFDPLLWNKWDSWNQALQEWCMFSKVSLVLRDQMSPEA